MSESLVTLAAWLAHRTHVACGTCALTVCVSRTRAAAGPGAGAGAGPGRGAGGRD